MPALSHRSIALYRRSASPAGPSRPPNISLHLLINIFRTPPSCTAHSPLRPLYLAFNLSVAHLYPSISLMILLTRPPHL